MLCVIIQIPYLLTILFILLKINTSCLIGLENLCILVLNMSLYT